jgi:hypothetical protein
MMSCDIIQILSQTIPDAIPTFSQISIWLCYIWLLYDSYACCYHSIFPETFHFLSLCYCYVLLSVMMMSSLYLHSSLLAVVPYCCLSPLFMYLLMNACHSSIFILRSPFISYVFVYTTLYLFLQHVIIIIYTYVKGCMMI